MCISVYLFFQSATQSTPTCANKIHAHVCTHICTHARAHTCMHTDCTASSPWKWCSPLPLALHWIFRMGKEGRFTKLRVICSIWVVTVVWMSWQLCLHPVRLTHTSMEVAEYLTPSPHTHHACKHVYLICCSFRHLTYVNMYHIKGVQACTEIS